MNLVAKEYVACQVADPGVLVLSKLAGSAQTMREALRVNPYDIDGTAEAIHRALEMEEAERRSRIVALRRRERHDDIEAWVHSFLAAADRERAELHPLGDADFEAWLDGFLQRYRLALFLDYDGTLCNLQDHPSLAKLTPAMRKALVACASRPDTKIAVVSGRALADVRAMVNHPGLIYAGNHGLEIASGEFPPFVHEDLVHYRHRAEEIARSLEKLEVDGAWTEAKGPTLTYHYRAVRLQNREALVKEAQNIIHEAGYQARDAHQAVEARPPIGWDKGRAVLYVLRSLYGPSWSEHVRVIYVGDDYTDEDAFRFLAGLAITFRVGSADTPTAATRRLPNVDAVCKLLEWLARRDLAEIAGLNPQEISILAGAALATSMLSAVVGMAGGIILLSVMLLFLDPLVAIPLHGVIQLVSNGSRTFIQRAHVRWSIIGSMAVLLLPMSIVGLYIARALSPPVARLLIGVFVLAATWAPALLLLGTHPERTRAPPALPAPRRRRRHRQHDGRRGRSPDRSLLSQPGTQPSEHRRHQGRQPGAGAPGEDRRVRIRGLRLPGVRAARWPCCALMVVAGTWIGSHLLEYVSDVWFTRLFKTALTLVALRLVIWEGLALLAPIRG